MNENLKAFLAAAEADSELREKLTKMTVPEIVAAAREKGFELTEADLEPPAGEMDDAELDNVTGGDGRGFCIAAGGAWGKNKWIDNDEWTCGCFAFGWGNGGNEPNCFCVAAGWGSNN